MESHFQGLEESSYLVEGESTHLKKKVKLGNKAKWKKKMRDILEKTVPPPSSRGRWESGLCSSAPPNTPPFFSPPAQTSSPVGLSKQGGGKCPGVWRGSFGRVSARLTCKREAKRCRSDQRDTLWA